MSHKINILQLLFQGGDRLSRMVTSSYRGLPDFIIIGAQKGGTTSLFDYLSQHPCLIPSSVKEVHYFDGGLTPGLDKYARGLKWYRSHFPLQDKLSCSNLTYEASPLYAFHPVVPGRIAKILPDIKLIFLLRDPVERAISHYFHEQRKGREKLPIIDAMLAEEERLQYVEQHSDYNSMGFLHFSYKSRGIYHEQIGRYWNHFSKEQLLVLESEQLFSDPMPTVAKVLDFIGVSRQHLAKWKWNPKNVGNNRTKVDGEVYGYLQNFFAPHNEILFDLIGENYGWLR